MSVPVDDHGFHRGHAVFDTANLVDGKLYGLSFHLDRLLSSCAKAKIAPFAPKETLRSIILRTVAASGQRNGVGIRFWMTAGRGDFQIHPFNLKHSNFYCIVHSADEEARLNDKLVGIPEAIVSIPLKQPELATTKTNNYLINALTAIEARGKGGRLGIQLDSRGKLAEASIGSIAVVTKNGLIKSPKMDVILRSTTLIRANELLLRRGERGIEFCDLAPDDAYAASEIIGFGGAHASSIVKLDGRVIGTGAPGSVFKHIDALLTQDMKEGGDEVLDAVPYQATKAAL